MPWFTDTASAPVVYTGSTDFTNRWAWSGGGDTALVVQRESVTTTTREIRGLTWAAALASASAWADCDNTSAIVTRASDGGNYTVIVTTETRVITPET